MSSRERAQLSWRPSGRCQAAFSPPPRRQAVRAARCCLPGSRCFRVHHFRGIDSLGEDANPPTDLAQAPLAVLVVGIFAAAELLALALEMNSEMQK